MHVYVWLDPHPELAAVCAPASPSVVTIESAVLAGRRDSDLRARPCHTPDPKGALGYAIAFRRQVPGDHEQVEMEVRPNGYP